jgi:predicted GNAT superfamily acetyltransferase
LAAPRRSTRRPLSFIDRQDAPTMTEPLPVSIGIATPDDLDGILALQAANQPEQGGMLSVNFARDKLVQLIADMPFIVARRGGDVTGFLVTASRRTYADVPVIRAMFGAYPGADDAYVCGPICVAADERGSGLARLLLDEVQQRLPDREGVSFIRDDNQASMRASLRAGFRAVGHFTHLDRPMTVVVTGPQRAG